MPVYFAAARSVAASPVARVLAKRAVPQAANDETGDAGTDATLRVALLHFAKHGLASAAGGSARPRAGTGQEHLGSGGLFCPRA